MKTVSPDLEWKGDRVPVSKRFDDPYYSLENGFGETQHVFLKANKLPERFVDGFSIGELGFGTGLNFLATLLEWRRSGQVGQLQFTSFEAYPLTKEDLARALTPFEDVASLSSGLIDGWSDLVETGQMIWPDVVLKLKVGDARKTLPEWENKADCWYLDGFSPAKNPELWGAELLSAVFEHTKTGGSAATYTAAGFVRRNLEAAGFRVQRVKGYGRKRHMTVAYKEAQNAK